VRLLVITLVVALLAGVGVANVVLLGYGADRNDPVGRLSPLLQVGPAASAPSSREVTTLTTNTTTVDRHGGHEGPDD
jgi:hypothetical protein